MENINEDYVIVENMKTLTLLCVEDNKTTQVIYNSIFEDLVKEIIFADDGADGYQKYLDNELSEKEKAFLQSHPVIRLGTDETWEPFVFKGTDGILQGVDIDFVRTINETSGSNIQLVTGRWAE